MNDNLKEKVSKILDLMLNGLEKAGDVASTELPFLIEEYLSLFFIEHFPIISTMFSMVLIIANIICFLMFKKIIDKNQKYLYLYRINVAITVVFAVVLSSTVADIKELVKIKVAPKAYLIEKLRR